jgi:hypothetical protein
MALVLCFWFRDLEVTFQDLVLKMNFSHRNLVPYSAIRKLTDARMKRYVRKSSLLAFILLLQCMYNVTLRRVSATTAAVEKRSVLHNLGVRVFVVLGIQHPTRMRRIVICGLPHSTKCVHIIGQTVRYQKKKLLNTKCVLILSTTFVCSISHSAKKWARSDQKCILVFM